MKQSKASFTLTTSEVAQALRLSAATLARLRTEGVLKAGVHYRAVGAGVKRPPLLWNVEACETALGQRSRQVLRAPLPDAATQIGPGYVDLFALPLRTQWGGWVLKSDRLVLNKMDYAIRFDSINCASDVLGWIVHMAGKNQDLYGHSVASDLTLAFMAVLRLGTMHSCQGPIAGLERAKEYHAKLKKTTQKDS